MARGSGIVRVSGSGPGPTLRAYASLRRRVGWGPARSPTILRPESKRMTNPAPDASPGPLRPAAHSDLPRARKRLSVRELPLTDRPRERLRAHGAHALSSPELLAILLGSGSGGRSALELGHDVLAAGDGSLRRLASQPVATLISLAGMGPARAVAVHAALEKKARRDKAGRAFAARKSEPKILLGAMASARPVGAQQCPNLPIGP